MNEEGCVVGKAQLASGVDHAFLWCEGAGFIDLTPDFEGRSSGEDVNASLEVVGFQREDSDHGSRFHAFLWKDGVLKRLDALLPPDSGWKLREAHAINDLGQIVGVGEKDGQTRGFLLTPGTPDYGIVMIGEPGEVTATPYDINNLGEVVGKCSGAGCGHGAFLWKDGEFTDLGSLSDRGLAVARAINNHSQVVGMAEDESYTPHAFIWEGGVMQDLGTMGGSESWAWGISDASEIIGNWKTWDWEPQYRSFVWKDGVSRTLEDELPRGLGVEFGTPGKGINSAGEIALGGSHNETAGAWLLLPLAERVHGMDAAAFKGSTIEARISTSLPEGAMVSLSLDEQDSRIAVINRKGRGTARWIEQSGVHTLCVDGQPAHCATVECDPRPESYVVAELPPISFGRQTYARSVSAGGLCVGDTYSEFYEAYRATLWNGSAPVDLGTLGGNGANAFGVNAAGWVVGRAENADGEYGPCIWKNGPAEDLVTLGGPGGTAWDINDAGLVVGHAERVDETASAALWVNGRIEDLGIPEDGTQSFARDINERGEVVGHWYPPRERGYYRPFRWTRSEGIVALETLDDSDGLVYAINNHGTAVGFTEPNDGFQHPVVWDADGRITDLGLVRGDSAWVTGINDENLMVGRAFFPVIDDSHAVLWRDGIVIDLNDYLFGACAWSSLEGATAINPRGQILGSGRLAGESRAFLMTPAYPGNIKRLSARCKGDDLVVSVKSWLPALTTLTAAADTGMADCMRTDESGRGKVRLDRAAGASSVCLLEFADMCEPVACR
ncbi:MAG: hypothetical protein IT449_07965 [Phycisphaerales bacterium]|nr:hypothetical protein [Phycisphaerales bacterium]